MTEDEKKEFLEIALKRFDECVSAESDNRERAIEALNFKEGRGQWPDQVKRDRESDGRPCLTLNRIPRIVRQIVNEMRQLRPSVKVRAVDSNADPETAEIMNGMIKAIEQSCNAEIAYDWAGEGAVTNGWGYVRIDTDYTDDMTFEQEIKVKRVSNPFTVYLDPNAQEPDGSDAKYGFVDSWMDKDEFEDKHPKAKSSWPDGGAGTSKEQWYKDSKVRVMEYWTVNDEEQEISLGDDGQTYIGSIDGAIKTRKVILNTVKQYIITAQDILDEKDFASRYIPIIPVYGEEMNIEGERILKGVVTDLIDSQRQYNYWRSSSTERVALSPKAPYIGATGQFKSPKWRNANQKNYPYLEYDMVEKDGTFAPPPQRQAPPDVPMGMIQEITAAAQELKEISGVEDPSLGAPSNERSGIAIISRQKKGEISNFHFIDNLSRSMRHVGRVLVDLIPKIYDTARIVRIIGEDGEEDNIPINSPYIDQKTQRDKFHNLTAGKYDVSVTVGPSYSTQRQEAAEAMLELVGSDQRILPLIGDILAKNFDWPEADEVSKRLKALLPAEIAGQENPQVAMLIQQSKDQVAQAGQQIQYLTAIVQQLEQENRKKDLQLNNKQGEISLKAQEMARKTRETFEELQQGWAKLELDNRNQLIDIAGKGVDNIGQF